MHNAIIDSDCGKKYMVRSSVCTVKRKLKESYGPNIGGEHQSTFSFSRSIIDVK